MNVEQLHTIARAIADDIEQQGLQNLLQHLASALENLVNQPNEASYQTEVHSARQRLRRALEQSAVSQFPATWRETLEDLGIEDALGTRLEAAIDEAFQQNQVTPAVVRDEVNRLQTNLQDVALNLRSLLAGFEYFEIESEDVEESEVEISVLIPRGQVKDELGALGQEFQQLQRHLAVFEEIATGSRSPIRVRAISSSNFGVFLHSLPLTAALVAKTIDWLLDSYKKVLEIRELHGKLAEQKVPTATLRGVSDHANSLMSEAIAEMTQRLMQEARINDPSRRNEVENELVMALNALADRIDRGYNIDVRAGLSAPEDSEEADADPETPEEGALRNIIATASTRTFINATGTPILHLGAQPPAAQKAPAPKSSKAPGGTGKKAPAKRSPKLMP